MKSTEQIFQEAEALVASHGISVEKKDDKRPWGGFLVISESDADKFIKAFFPNLSAEKLKIAGKLSPKILLAAPGKRLSWQYHHRRAEIWKLLRGDAAVTTSDTDEEKDTKELTVGDVIELRQGERHRLIGRSDWGMVAEIWRHTDKNNPSDEDDIVRVQDDFGR